MPGKQTLCLCEAVDAQINLFIQSLPVHGGCGAPSGAVEQLGFQGAFQISQSPAERGNRHAELFCGCRQAACLHDGDEQAQIVQVHAGSFFPYLETSLPFYAIHIHALGA